MIRFALLVEINVLVFLVVTGFAGMPTIKAMRGFFLAETSTNSLEHLVPRNAIG